MSSKKSIFSGVTFALDEEDEDQEEDEEEEENDEQKQHGITSCNHDPQVDDSGDSCSIVIHDIGIDEEEVTEQEHEQDHYQYQEQDQDQEQDCREEPKYPNKQEVRGMLEDFKVALVEYLTTIRFNTSSSSSSSDFWKGLLIGLFLCQAVFVPIWACCSVSDTTTTTSNGGLFTGFLSLMVRRLVVWSVAAVGFVIIGLVAIEYDRALHQEIEELRHQTKIFQKKAEILQQSRRSRTRNDTSHGPNYNVQATSSNPQAAVVASVLDDEDAQEVNLNNTFQLQSVSVTAPSTSSSQIGPEEIAVQEEEDKQVGILAEENLEKEIVLEEDDSQQAVEDDDIRKDHAPSVARRKMSVEEKAPTEAIIVNHTPDTLPRLDNNTDHTSSRVSFSGGASHFDGASVLTPMPPIQTTPKDKDSVHIEHQQENPSSSATTPDFYPDATVLMAHISGFSAWSSQRSPDQVFTLLEKLHKRFDEAAKRFEITKVEAISESYMAATGVAPEPQPDHAIRMIKFAKQIMQSMVKIVTALESTLGPGTMDLRLRIGIHSGSLTAGYLGGRLRAFGSSVEIATVMESTSHRNRIQVSGATAELLRQAEKADWIQKRDGRVTTTKGTEVQTYYVVVSAPLSGRGGKPAYQSQASNKSLRSLRSAAMQGGGSVRSSIGPSLATDQSPKVPKRRQVWDDDGEDNFILSLPPMSRNAKNKRLVGWVVKLLQGQLEKLVAQRGSSGYAGRSRHDFEISDEVLSRVCYGAIPVDEVVDAFRQRKTDVGISDRSTISSTDMEVKLDAKVESQLREMVTKLASLYRDLPYHSFERASSVTMAVQKLLSRCTPQDDDDDISEYEGGSGKGGSMYSSSESRARQYMTGVASDALSHFAIHFAALAQDCGHEGLSSDELSTVKPKLSEQYSHVSVGKQNSIDLAWQTLMDPQFTELQSCLFWDEYDLQRFRSILVNTVLATDWCDEAADSKQSCRWDRAFLLSSEQGSNKSSRRDEDPELKATSVVCCLVQAGDISHTMQHWKVYQKWSERFFREKFITFDAGHSLCNPTQTWFEEELNFLDNCAIPLAKKLSEAKVFGVASNECLNNAVANRRAWAERGEQLVKEMHQRYCKRKEMEIGGFTNEEINNFTPKELDYIMKKLVEKGRNRGTNEVDAEKGQNDAAQAWLDALEIYEQSPAAAEIADRSVVFPIYSGVFVWIKGGKIQQDPDGYFEMNLARKFVCESKLHLDPIHHTRALAMLSEVFGKQGKYIAALQEIEKLKDIYSIEAHSLAVADVYGTDRSAQAFSFSALWHDQLGNDDEALAACEYVIQDILPMMDPKNTLGNFELLLNVIRVMKPKGQEKRMKQLLQDYVVAPFQKHHGPTGFTPCMSLFKPLLWLLDLCADPANFVDLDIAVDWLMEDENGIAEEFLDNIYAKACWAPHDMIAELCLRLANRLALESGDTLKQRILVQKGLALAWRSEKKMTDTEGNVVLPIANEIHEPVFNALFEVARQMGLRCEEEDHPSPPKKELNVNLPPSYLEAPDL